VSDDIVTHISMIFVTTEQFIEINFSENYLKKYIKLFIVIQITKIVQ